MRRRPLLVRRVPRIVPLRCCTGCFLPESPVLSLFPSGRLPVPTPARLKPGPSRGPVFSRVEIFRRRRCGHRFIPAADCPAHGSRRPFTRQLFLDHFAATGCIALGAPSSRRNHRGKRAKRAREPAAVAGVALGWGSKKPRNRWFWRPVQNSHSPRCLVFCRWEMGNYRGTMG